MKVRLLFLGVLILMVSKSFSQIPYEFAKYRLEIRTIKTMSNYYELSKKPTLASEGVSLFVDHADSIFFDGTYLGQSVYLINNSDSTIHSIRSKVPDVFLQYYSAETNDWIDLTYIDESYCNFHITYFDLPTNCYIKMTHPKFTVNSLKKLRYYFRFNSGTVIYSDEFIYQ